MKRNIMHNGLLVLAGSVAALQIANAQEPAEPMFSLSGFGTLGVVHSSEEQADFGASVFAPRGAGYSSDWSPEVDSRLGAQVVARFTPSLTGTLQLVSDQNYKSEYWPRVEWANIKYQITPDLSVRVGRTALTSFLVSDSRKVGYANPWVRPPYEVYGLIPLFKGDGVDVSYRIEAGRAVHTLLAGWGTADPHASDGETYKSKGQWTVSDTVDYGDTTLRIAYQTAKVKITVMDALFAGFRQFGPQGEAIADRYDPNGRVTFLALGAMYDPGRWFVTAEWGRVNLHSALGERTGWYTTGGYRFGDFTPYLTYSNVYANSNTSDSGLSLAGLPPDAAATAAALNAGLNAVLGSIPRQKTVSVGARWDFMKNFDLKLQYNHINLAPGSAGVFGNVQPGFQPGGTVHLFSATVDFVW